MIEKNESDMRARDVENKNKAAMRRKKTYHKSKVKKERDKASSDILIQKRKTIDEIPTHMYAKTNRFGTNKETLKKSRMKDKTSHAVKKELAKSEAKVLEERV